MKTSLWTRILELIAPRACAVCGKRLSITEHAVCSPCLLHLPRTTYQFTPYDNPMAQLFWGLAPVSQASALFFYEPHSELARLIYHLKYGNRPDIGEDLGRIMAEEMRIAGFLDSVDVLLPVPLSSRRLRQRGYNQSEMLCRGIREITNIPVETKVLIRKHFYQSQTHLMRHQRQANVAEMFHLRDAAGLAGKHVLLVDDICTTGATLIACINALNQIPRLRVSVLTLGFTKS